MGWVLPGPSLLLLFTLDYLYENSHSHTGLILLIAWNLPFYKHFAFCLFVWLMQLKCVPHHLTPLRLFLGIICNTERLRGGTWSPELLSHLNWRGDLGPLFLPWLSNLVYCYNLANSYQILRCVMSRLASLDMEWTKHHLA